MLSKHSWHEEQKAAEAIGIDREYRGAVVARGDLAVDMIWEISSLFSAREDQREKRASPWTAYLDCGGTLDNETPFRVLARCGALATRIYEEQEKMFLKTGKTGKH